MGNLASHDLRTTGCQRVTEVWCSQLYFQLDISEHVHSALTPAGKGWYSIYLPRRGGRLSWPRCPIMPGPGIEPMTARSEVRRPNHCTTETPRVHCYCGSISQCNTTWHMSSMGKYIGPVRDTGLSAGTCTVTCHPIWWKWVISSNSYGLHSLLSEIANSETDNMRPIMNVYIRVSSLCVRYLLLAK